MGGESRERQVRKWDQTEILNHKVTISEVKTYTV